MLLPLKHEPPAGFAAIGVFFFFGATMAAYAAVTLLEPGTFLDRAWALNPSAHLQLSAMGRVLGLPFMVLAVALLFAGIGWFQRRYWGWLLGASLIAVNLAGDVITLLRGQRFKGAVGIAAAGLLLFYMTRLRSYFLRV
jgi:hypothetical protein